MSQYQVINPTTEAIHATYELLTFKEVLPILEVTHRRYLEWRMVPLDHRLTLVKAFADALEKNKVEYAKLMVNEMGKPLAQGVAEIEKCVRLCLHYVEYTPHYLASRRIVSESLHAEVHYEPLGVVLGIMPWNFPFWQVLRLAIPQLLAGNGFILKHAPQCFGTGRVLSELFTDVGFPEGLFQDLMIDVDVIRDVIAHPVVVGVSLTGSQNAGRMVASSAGAHLKKVVLELGGSDPYLVLSDADLEHAAGCIIASRLNNAGQVCVSAKRVIVVSEVLPDLVGLLKKLMDSFQLGPLARLDLRDVLHQQVLKSVKCGARLELGGIIPQKTGFFYPPTLLTHVAPGMPAFDEELFGPVIAVIVAKDEQEAVTLANQTCFGLGAAVFTQNESKGRLIAAQLNVGMCAVNDFVRSDPQLPFGGIKESGFGRELSMEGMLSFVNVKSLMIGKNEP